MWLKLILITTFFVFVALLSRVMDMMAINGADLLSAHIFLNTVGLSVRQLKYLLDARGISYEGVLERPELIQLVDDSGPVTERQLMDCADEDLQHQYMAAAVDADLTADDVDNYLYHEKSGSHRFSSGAHLYEEVEDTKDSAWIVNVVAIGGHNRIDSKLWAKVVDKSSRFGIRSAIFDCSVDPALCHRKGWLSSRLILALPREGLRTKEDVLMVTFFTGRHTRLQHVIDWIHKQLATRVSLIDSADDLQRNWLRTSKDEDFADNEDNDNNSTSISAYNELKLVFISSLATPPLILSALAIKFSGRVRFGFFRTDTKRKRTLVARLDKRIPSYIIALSDRHYHYGYKAGESLKYSSIELMLRTLRPETNDLFLVTLILTNLSLGLHLFWMKCSRLWKHLIYWFMTAIKYNCILFLVWLTAVTLYNVPLMATVCAYGHRVCQWLALTPMATILRYDFQYNYKWTFLAAAFTAFGLLVAVVRRTLISCARDDNDDHLLFRDWTPWESTLLSYILFRPIGMNSFHRSMTANSSIDMNLEEGMELLIERLAVPNLWLQPELICSDYIKELPVWIHQNTTTGSEVSDSDESVFGGDVLSAKTAEEHPTSGTTLTSTKSTLETAATGGNRQQLCRSLHSSHKPSAHSADQCQRYSASNAVTATAVADTSNNCGDSTAKCVNNSGNKARVSPRSVIRHRPQQPTGEAVVGGELPALPEVKESKVVKRSNPNLMPDGTIKCNECAICLDPYRTGVSICGLPCGHNYHLECIMLWLYRDNHCCPTCRWPTYKQKQKCV